MPPLQSIKARRCATAAGILVHEHEVLLLLHKKVQLWLAPGGHIEEHELPHHTAQREFFEESGINVKAISSTPLLESKDSQYIPNPFAINLHWVCKKNYEYRIASSTPSTPHTSQLWPRGCEQHYTFLFLVRAIGSTKPIVNTKESLDIQWFSRDALSSDKILPSIRNECLMAIDLADSIN